MQPTGLHFVDALGEILAMSDRAGGGIYLGGGPSGPVFAPPEHAALVLGPPRSGKTSSVVMPNLLAAGSAVVVTSTKRDVLDQSAAARQRIGPCYLYDPSGSIAAPPGVELVGWSPLGAASDWDGALLVSASMVGASRPGSDRGEALHWSQKAHELIATLLHAGALAQLPLSDVLSWVNRHEAGDALSVLANDAVAIPCDVLAGIVRTDEREQSGIWSTASSVLSAYHSPAALVSASVRPLAPADIVEERATLYVIAPAERQRLLTPLVAGAIGDVRRAAYTRHSDRPEESTERKAHTAERPTGERPTGRGAASLLLVLDELANIAPLHDLPEIVAEGGSQGVLTLACLQDLSQARRRWPDLADGFFTLFSAKILLPGIGDTRTIEGVSLLAGEREETIVSQTTHGRGQGHRQPPSQTLSTRRVRRLPPDAIALGRPDKALVLLGAAHGHVELTPFYERSPWREAASGHSVIAGRSWTKVRDQGQDREHPFPSAPEPARSAMSVEAPPRRSFARRRKGIEGRRAGQPGPHRDNSGPDLLR